MNFVSLGLGIFLAGLTIAHGEKILSKSDADHDAFREIDCLRANRGRVVGESSCKPHNRLVELKPMPGYEFRPSKVSVKQCDGNCGTGTSCQTVKTKKIEVHVTMISLFESMARKCAAVEVEEHVRCRCKCIEKESDCNDRQMYDASKCKCMCKEENEKKIECENKPGMVWDKDDCSCKCPTNPEYCMTAYKWSEAECKCVRA